MSYANKAFTVTALGLVLGCSAPVLAAQQHQKNKHHKSEFKKSKQHQRNNHLSRRPSETDAPNTPSAADTVVPSDRSNRVIRPYIQRLMAMPVGIAEYNRLLKLVNSLPGYQVSSTELCNKSGKVCAPFFMSRFKKYNFSIGALNYGVGQYGKVYLAATAGVNDLLGADRLQVSTATPFESAWDNVYNVTVNYNAVLTQSGLTLLANYVNSYSNLKDAVADPSPFNTLFRGDSRGDTVAVGLSHPLYLGFMTAIHASVELNYASSDGTSLNVSDNIPSASKGKTPAVVTRLTINHQSTIGVTDMMLAWAKGTDLPFMTRDKERQGTTDPAGALTSEDTAFSTLQLMLSQLVPFGRGWEAHGSLFSQWKFTKDGDRVPGSYKISYNEGGYSGMAPTGDDGFYARMGFKYHVSDGRLAAYGVVVHGSYGYAALDNVKPSQVPYTKARVQDYMLGVGWRVPKVHARFDLSFAQALRAPREIKGIRVLLAAAFDF